MADKMIKAETNAVAPTADKAEAVATPVVKPAAAPVAAAAAPTPVIKAEAPKTVAPKVEAAKVDAPAKVEAPKVAVPTTATPAAEPAKAAPAKPVMAKAAPVAAKPVAKVTAKVVAKPVKALVAAKTVAKAPSKTNTVKTPVKTNTVTKPAAASAPVASTIQKEVNIMENTVKTATDKAQTMFVDMNDRAKAAMEKTQGLFADMNEFNKGNVEALVESSKIAAKGIESMGQEAAEYTRKSFEGMTAIVKSLASVKSPTEFMKLQSDYVRTSFDSLVAESSKSTEAMLKLAGEIAQPISNRVAVAAEKIKISA